MKKNKYFILPEIWCFGIFQLKKSEKSMTFDMDIQKEYFFCHLWINLLKHWEKNPDEN